MQIIIGDHIPFNENFFFYFLKKFESKDIIHFECHRQITPLITLS